MTVQQITNALLFGLAADTKPTTYANNTLFYVMDTGDLYRWNLGTTTWVLLQGASKTETLTNKTLTTPVISSISNSGTITIPTGTDQLVARATTDTLTNKTVNATNNTITDTSTAAGDLLESNGTKFVRFPRGSGSQLLRTNTGATDIEWYTATREDLACNFTHVGLDNVPTSITDAAIFSLTGGLTVVNNGKPVQSIDFTNKTQFRISGNFRVPNGVVTYTFVDDTNTSNTLGTIAPSASGYATTTLASLPGWATGVQLLRVRLTGTAATDDTSAPMIGIYLK